MDFLHFAIANGYSICINGDGVDIMQMTLHSLTRDLTPCLALFAQLGRDGRKIYYTVGNHDIQLEHFLSNFGPLNVVPFLNLRSGDQRIRIEHGHTYDEMFLKYPRFYWLFTMIGRWAIAVGPEFYERLHDLNLKIIAVVEYIQSGFKRREKPPEEGPGGQLIEGERQCFRNGAEMVSIRGFDAVVFGHTHIEGEVTLSSGVRYFNTGGWFHDPHCVAIDTGRVWFGSVERLIAGGDPFPRPRPLATAGTA